MLARAALTFGFSLSLFVVGCSGGGGGGGNNNGNKDMASSGGNSDMATSGNKNDMTTPTSACAIGTQDGCDADEKCIPTFDDNDNVLGKCVSAGTVAIGGDCTVSGADNELDDNCVKGAACDADGADAKPLCRKICTANADCTTAGDKCFAFFDSSFGVCLPTCEPFATSCPAGNDCSGNWNDIDSTEDNATGYFWCKPTGTGAADDDCETDADCGANLWCDYSFGLCTPACDDSHTCEAGGGTDLECVPFPNLANGAGYCN